MFINTIFIALFTLTPVCVNNQYLYDQKIFPGIFYATTTQAREAGKYKERGGYKCFVERDKNEGYYLVCSKIGGYCK